jgi:hypothetical protein
MHTHLSETGPHAVFPLAIMLVLLALRLRHRRKLAQNLPSKPKRHRRFRFTGAVLGNALQTIHIFVDPGVRYVIAEKIEEPSEDDDRSDSTDPARQFERQLRRIRRGEQIGRLIVSVKEEE